MSFTPDHILAQTTYRQDQLRRDAEARRLGRTVRLARRTRQRRRRQAVAHTAATITGRIRRSLNSLTEWPRPV
jgi:hypothetical protein